MFYNHFIMPINCTKWMKKGEKKKFSVLLADGWCTAQMQNKISKWIDKRHSMAFHVVNPLRRINYTAKMMTLL